MKKFISIFISLIFTLLPLTVYAQEDVPAETKIMMGDVTNDRKVSAADARAVLRMAAGLDSTEGVSLLAADPDTNGKITAADARLILRTSAKIEPLTCGFDADGNLNSINLIKNGNYALYATVVDGSDGLPMLIACNGSDFCFKYMETFVVDGAEPGNDTAEESDVFSDMGFLIVDGKTYAIMTMNGTMCAFSEEFIEFMNSMASSEDEMLDEVDIDELVSMADFVNSLIADDIGMPRKVTENGADYFVYNYPVSDQTVTLRADSYGRIVNIIADNGLFNITFDSLSSEIDPEIFNIKNYAVF